MDCLQSLKGSGKFVSMGSAKFILPGLEVNDLGAIAFPINKLQAEGLKTVAHKAPFGMGYQTIIDEKVRSGWEIDAENLKFNNPDWESFLRETIQYIKRDLGLEDYTISARPYKMLLYEEGDFFLAHQDSEKEKGMFGTLIIGLPSHYTGGELAIRFEGKEEIADFSQPDFRYQLNYAAFYADCEHEVKPVTSGYRVSLTYNLIQEENERKIDLPSVNQSAQKLAKLFTENVARKNSRPYIILLGHQYTPENFSENNLKLNDRFRAKALLEAAKEAGFYAKLCLVTSYLSGAPEVDGYGYDRYEEETEMGEVYDEDLRIEEWLPEGVPALSHLYFQEEELITSFPLNEGEPIVKENTGFMGNYGPDIMYWYHYGAVVIWSPEVNAKLLPLQSVGTQLEWINYFSKTDKIHKAEIESVKTVLTVGLTESTGFTKKPNFNAIIDWLIKQKNNTFFVRLSRERLQFFFEKIDAEQWTKLFGFLPADVTHRILGNAAENITKPVLEKLISVMVSLNKETELKDVATEQITLLPKYFGNYYTNHSKGVGRDVLADLFELSQSPLATENWITVIVKEISKNIDWNYVHDLLAKELLATEINSKLIAALRAACKTYLLQRVSDKPQPPKDWHRPMPASKHYQKQWQILKPFLESAEEKVFDFRKNQAERTEMENAIKEVNVDLRTETIRIGSPHILRITKTQAAYNRLRKKWKMDVTLLKSLSEK